MLDVQIGEVNASSLKERGFDFAYAAQAFFDQDRLQLLGRIDSRIISARKANTREVKEYDNDTTEN